MARRGDALSKHILWVAKEIFLEMGFERASMDMVAARAETSKRSFYAYYPSKEKLFSAVIELVHGLSVGALKMPADYSAEANEAIVLFCARYLEILLFERSIHMCRVSMAETARFPDGAVLFFDSMFTEVHTRLSGYLVCQYQLSENLAGEAAQSLLGQILYPRFPRALFGVDQLTVKFDAHKLSPDFDLLPVRKAVDGMIKLYVESN